MASCFHFFRQTLFQRVFSLEGQRPSLVNRLPNTLACLRCAPAATGVQTQNGGNPRRGHHEKVRGRLAPSVRHSLLAFPEPLLTGSREKKADSTLWIVRKGIENRAADVSIYGATIFENLCVSAQKGYGKGKFQERGGKKKG